MLDGGIFKIWRRQIKQQRRSIQLKPSYTLIDDWYREVFWDFKGLYEAAPKHQPAVSWQDLLRYLFGRKMKKASV